MASSIIGGTNHGANVEDFDLFGAFARRSAPRINARHQLCIESTRPSLIEIV
jgi:hypothetical protein